MLFFCALAYLTASTKSLYIWILWSPSSDLGVKENPEDKENNNICYNFLLYSFYYCSR